jgi:ATP-binding cassette, subfamily B, bacterial
VLVFDAGRLVEDGSHDDLLARGGLYTRMHKAWTRTTSQPSPAGGLRS